MTERTLKAALVAQFKEELPGCVVFSHTGAIDAGIPDLSVTWNRVTTWLEVKYDRRGWTWPGIQHVNLRRLELHGQAYYVIYELKRGQKTVWVSLPSVVEVGLHRAEWSKGFNHQFVVDFVRQRHQK